MSDFVFVGSKSSRASRRLTSRMPALVSALGYQAQRIVAFETSGDRMAAVQFARSTNLYPSEHQRNQAADGVVTLLKGHVIGKQVNEASILSAADISRELTGGVAEIRRKIVGDYGVCHFDSDRAIFFCDPLSMVSIFYCETSEGDCIVSTRPRLIREMLAEWDYDYRNLAWQAVAYWPLGGGTLINGVKRIPQAGTLEWSQRGLRVVECPLFFLNNPERKNLSAALIHNPNVIMDRVISKMASSLQAVIRAAPKATLAITGGRDSRAIAALATIGADVPPNLDFFTNGVPEHPDVVVGRRIAEAVGARFFSRIPGRSSYSSREILKQRLGAIFRYDGMQPIWDGGGDAGVSSNVLLQGHVGEIFRDKWFKGKYASPEDYAKRAFKSGAIDPNGLLLPHVAADFERELAARAAWYVDNGAQLDQIAGVFRVEGMQSWESAQFSQGALWASHPVHPLYDPEMIDISFAAPPEWRDDERIHYEIIRRSRHNLADIPFAGHAWHRGLAVRAGCRSVDVEPVASMQSLVSAAGWQAGLFFSSPLQRRFLEIVDACGGSPLWDYFDREKAITAIRNASPTMSSMQMTRMYSLLTSLCYAHGYEIPVKFGASASTDGLESRTVLVGGSGGKVLYDGRKSAIQISSPEDYAGVPMRDVPDGVVALLQEPAGASDDEADLYEMYGQLRCVTLEKRKIELELKKVQTAAGVAAPKQNSRN